MPLFGGHGAVGALLQGEKNHAQHLVPRRRLAGPDFELAGGLMGEHLDARNDLSAPLLAQLQEAGLGGIVNHIKDIAGIDLVLLQRSLASVAHPNRGGIDDDIECQFLQIGALDDARPGLVS